MPRHQRLGVRFIGDGESALGDVLGEIADALQVRRDAQCAHDVTQVVGHRLTACDHGDDLLFDLALEVVDRLVGLHDVLGELRVAAFERAQRLPEQLFSEAAHLGDLLVEQSKLFLVGFYGVLIHGRLSWRTCGTDCRGCWGGGGRRAAKWK